ncbi:MAG: PAS domain S-box protein, partial [Acidobacteriota bacterium]|nr:PAS domain S-box protein [Acidobacteriota bacterium]
ARKRADESMRESEERFRATFENAGIGVALVDLQGRPIKSNPALRQMLGYSMEELSRMAFTEFTHPDDRELDWALFTDLVAGKREKYEIEKRFVRKDGGLVWGLLTVSLVKGGDGRPVRAVGMVQDITERKRADEELRLTQFSLDCASDGVFWMDSQGRIIRVNEAACRSLGRSHEELLSLSIPDIDPLLPKEAWGPFWEKIKTCGSIAFETQHQTKRGKIFPVEVTSNYLEFDGKEYAFAFSHDITERKRAGEELYQSRQMLQTILDTIPQRVFWKNRDISYLGCNQAFAVDAGLKDPAEIVGKNDYELAWKETAERYRADDKSVMEDEAPRLNFDEPQNRPDGSLMWLRTNKLPLHDQGGKVIGILGTYEDITERKRATARLAAQARIAEIFLSVSDCDIYQEILKLILDNLHSSLGLFGFIDEDGGLEVPSMTREIWHMCQMPEKTTRFPRNTWGESSWARALKEQRTIYSNELSASTPQGYIHVCRHIALPILFHGEAIGLFVVANKETDYTKDDVQTLENIAHHVAPILSARLQRQRAEGTRDYLASIVEYSDDAIFGTSVEGIIRSWNAGAEKLYGYTTAEVVGQSVFCLAPPDRRKEMEGFLNQLNQGKKIEPQETVRVTKNGGLVDVSVTISPLKNASGEVTGASTVARDITARRGIERMKDELVSVVSHELRTPLTSIRGALGLLAGGLLRSQPEKGNRMLEIAVTNTDRLVRLINDVLDLERMDSGKMKMEKQTCNAADLMTQSVDSVRDLADKAGVTLSVSPYSARIWVDPDRIIQALINLLSNAIKFSTRGGTIWLSATPRADQLLFQVKDQGRGIPQDMLESIFERFQQVDASDRRDKGGTGLGLPITRKIVQQHDGRIWVESALGQGSTFSFTIPLLQAETILVGDGSGTRKVLVCTVETDILSAVQAVLNQRGYTVLASPTWQEAIKMASSESPDAILVDWSLPGMEDMETMASWKQKSPTRDIPVIGLGGTAPDEVHLTSMGLAGWVAKPVNEASLLLALGSVLGKPGEGPRVLVVEDDADLARVLMTIFERHGAVVFHARTGREAAKVCPQFIPDLLVLDVMLPELDGFGVVEKLRQHKHLQHLPLAVYSVRELDDSEKARLRLGESIFMTKSRLTPQEFEQRAIGLLNWATSGQRERRRQ